MKKDIIYNLSSPYRDDFRVTGYRFGKGGKSCCIIGSIRGNEIQQLYMCLNPWRGRAAYHTTGRYS